MVSIFTKLLEEHTETICMIVQIKHNIQIQFLKILYNNIEMGMKHVEKPNEV